MNGSFELILNEKSGSLAANINGFKVNMSGDWQTLMPVIALLWGQVQAEVAKKPDGWQGVLKGWGAK